MAAPREDRRASRDSSAQNDLWRSDEYRMNYMKVTPCHKKYAHDWSSCPYAHPREGARRRDPRLYTYTGIACPNMKQGGRCELGDACPFAHNVFEYWLHPTRYRTQLCNDGSNCKRFLCFFAHALEELRVPECRPWVPSPAQLAEAAAAAASASGAPPADGERDPGRGSPNHAAPQRNSLQQHRSPRPSMQHLEAGPPFAPLVAPFGVAAGGSPARMSSDQHARMSIEQQQGPRRSLPGFLPGPPDSRGASLDMARRGDLALPSAADVAAHEALSSALRLAGPSAAQGGQQQPGQQPDQGCLALVDVVLGLLERGQVSPERSAAILHRLLPAQELSRLQAQLATSGSHAAGWEPARTQSDPLPNIPHGGSPEPHRLPSQPGLSMEGRSSPGTAAAAGGAARWPWAPQPDLATLVPVSMPPGFPGVPSSPGLPLPQPGSASAAARLLSAARSSSESQPLLETCASPVPTGLHRSKTSPLCNLDSLASGLEEAAAAADVHMRGASMSSSRGASLSSSRSSLSILSLASRPSGDAAMGRSSNSTELSSLAHVAQLSAFYKPSASQQAAAAAAAASSAAGSSSAAGRQAGPGGAYPGWGW